MQGRTFFRIMLDNLFVNNSLVQTIESFVKFCNEQHYYSPNELKFSDKKPLNNIMNDSYKNRYVFNSLTMNRMDTR